MKSQFIQIIALSLCLFSIAACIPRRIGYYSGKEYVNCDSPRTSDEVRVCDNIQYWYGKNK